MHTICLIIFNVYTKFKSIVNYYKYADLTITDPGFDITILSYENGSNYLETLSYYLSQTNFHGISVSSSNLHT